MILNEQQKFSSLDDWFFSPQGRRVAQAMASELTPVASFLKGTTLLQLGSLANNLWLEPLFFANKWLASPVFPKHQHTRPRHVLTEFNRLPIERHSVDCVVAPFTTELVSSDRRHWMNEIDRVLAPMGYAIFFGINPWSLWGFLLRFFANHWFVRDRVHLCSAMKLNYLFLNRGYATCLLSNFYYIPPFNHENIIHRLEFLNEMGKMMWPYPAGFYCLIVQKQDFGFLMPSMDRVDFHLARVC